jgi:Trk K+ transport system NAD-binding subunit
MSTQGITARFDFNDTVNFMQLSSTAALVIAKAAQDEALVRRMMGRWPVEAGTPVLVIDRGGNIVGLGPDTPIGSVQSVFVYAKDCAA